MPAGKLAILFGAAVAFAGSTAGSATCDASGCTSCVTADGSLGGASVCVNFTAPPPPPTCPTACTPACSMSPCLSNCDTSCSICVPSTLTGICLTVTQGTGYILGSNSSLNFGAAASVDFSLAFNNATLVTVDSSVGATVQGNAVVNLASSALVDALVLGGGLLTSAFVQVSADASVRVWDNKAANAKVDNNCSSLTVATLQTGGSSFSLYQRCPKANATFTSLDFSPRITLTGSSKLRVAGGVVRFNPDGSGNTTGTGTVELSGGVAVEGRLSASVTVDVRASANAPLISIDAMKAFYVAGNMTAETAGTVAVYGKLAFGEATAQVDPKVIVNAGATLVFNSSSTCRAKAVEVTANATLEVGANVKASTLALGQFAKCLGNVKINLATTASAFISSSGAGGAVAFTYTGGNAAELAKCTVQVIDSTGAAVTLTSRTSASAAAGRRLLQNSGGTATWSDSSMTYTMGQQQQASGAFVFTLAPAVVGLLALLA